LKPETEGIWTSEKEEKISYRTEGNSFINEVEEDSFWFEHRNKCVFKVMEIYPCGWLLDIGGGNGLIASQLLKKGIETILLEPGISGVLNAKARGVKHIIHGPFHRTLVNPNTISSVGLFDVLEHIEDDESFVKEIYNCLESGGRLYLTVPAFNILWSNSDKEVGHYRRYSLKELIYLLSKNGFKIEYASYIFWFLPIFIFLFRKVFTFKETLRKKKRNTEHVKNRYLRYLVLLALRIEVKLISIKKSVLIGSSCLIVATKNG